MTSARCAGRRQARRLCSLCKHSSPLYPPLSRKVPPPLCFAQAVGACHIEENSGKIRQDSAGSMDRLRRKRQQKQQQKQKRNSRNGSRSRKGSVETEAEKDQQMYKAMDYVKKKYLKKTEQCFIWFMLYSMIGWLYEVFLEVVVYRWGFSNRGVLHGPYCVIYGFGALLILLTLSRLKKKKIYAGTIFVTPLLVFGGIVAVATATELAGSYLMEWITGDWMWDYTRFSCNFQGRIAVNPSIRFGIGGMIILYLLQPVFEKLTGRMPGRGLAAVGGAMAAVLLVDVAFCLRELL